MKAIAQLDQAWEDKAANFAKAEALLTKASPDAGSQLSYRKCFTGYSINTAATTKDEPANTESFYQTIKEAQVLGHGGIRT